MKKTLSTLTLLIALAPWAMMQAAPTSNQSNTGTVVTVINGPNVESVKDTTAVVAWTTDRPSSAIVHYGPDKLSMNEQTAEQAWGGTQNGNGYTHRVTLRSLKPDTTYFFQVESGQGKGIRGGGDVSSAANSFKTLPSGATSSGGQNAAGVDVKVINGPIVESVRETSAVVAWTTDRPSSAIVHFGPDKLSMNAHTAEQAWGGTQNGSGYTHRVTLTGLKPDTTYFFQVESGQGKGIRGGGDVSSAANSFKTLPASGPSASASSSSSDLKVQAGPIPQAVTDKTTTIWWMTTADAPSVVKYGTDKNNLTQTAQGTAGREHRVELANLQPGTTYYFDVTDGNPNLNLGKGQFSTMGANYQAEAKKIHFTKGPVIEYITQDQAIIAWSTTARSSSLVRYGTDANNLSQTAEAPWGQDTHRVTVKNLKPNTTYYFVVESSQALGTGALAKSEPAPFMTVDKGQQAMSNPEPR